MIGPWEAIDDGRFVKVINTRTGEVRATSWRPYDCDCDPVGLARALADALNEVETLRAEKVGP